MARQLGDIATALRYLCGMRTFIISQPKAGTYLASALLGRLGMTETGIHVSSTLLYFQQYDLTRPVECRDGKVAVSMTHKRGSLYDILRLVPASGVAVGHLAHHPELPPFFRSLGFKVVVLTRPLEEMQAAWERWIETADRQTPPKYPVNTWNRVLPWLNEPDVFHLTFGDMTGRNAARVDDLQRFLFGRVTHDSAAALYNALATETLTKSGGG